MSNFDPRKAQAQLGNAKEQVIHQLNGKKGEKISLKNEDVKSEATLYIRSCEDCEIDFNSKCTKIMIEGCRRCSVTLKGRILTNIVEVWKCADVKMGVTADVRTLQLDICRNLDLSFATRDHLHTTTPLYVSGFDQMKETHADLNPIHDQFIVRIREKEISAEQIVRLANGYPTTEREAQEFDTQKEKNEKNAEEFVRKRLADAGITLGRKKSEEPKVGRNDPCKCGSGKKAKKCCVKDS